MHSGWSADFSYTYFRKLLHTVRSRFTAHTLGQAAEVLPNNGTPIVFLRHDVKVSPTKALRMAEIEGEYGLPASYMVRVDSPLYSLSERRTRIQLLEIVQMGHEVGLHFDLSHRTDQGLSYLRLIETEIHAACKCVEQIICRKVRSLSFHRFIPLLSGGALQLNGLINADSRELHSWCLSDAGGCYNGGEPLVQITEQSHPVLQLILHPIWWDERHALAPQRLQTLFDSATHEKSAREASIFDINLARIIPAVRRQAICALMHKEERK